MRRKMRRPGRHPAEKKSHLREEDFSAGEKRSRRRLPPALRRAKPGKKEKQKPKPITVRKHPPAKKAEPKKEKIKRTYSVLTGKEHRGWTEDEIEMLIRMYEDGDPYIEIMEAVRHSESSIATKLTKLRQEGRVTSIRSKEAWTQEQIDTLITMKAQGHTIEEICKVVGKSYAATWCKYKKIRIKEKEWEE